MVGVLEVSAGFFLVLGFWDVFWFLSALGVVWDEVGSWIRDLGHRARVFVLACAFGRHAWTGFRLARRLMRFVLSWCSFDL